MEKRDITFQTFDGFINTVDCIQPSNVYASSTRDEDMDWSGTDTYHDAINCAKIGWKDGLDRMERSIYDWKTNNTNISHQLVHNYNESGDEVDVGRFLDSDPCSMIEYHIETRSQYGKFVRVWVNIAASCSVSQETIFQRGAAILMFVDQLEQNGFRVELSAILSIGISKTSECFRLTVPVKEFEQQLDMERVAFCLGNPAMLRRLGFRMMELQGDSWMSNGPGQCYGYPCEIKDVPEDVVYFGEQFASSAKQAQNELNKFLANAENLY